MTDRMDSQLDWQLLWVDIAGQHRHFDSIDSTNTALITDIANGALNHDALHLYTADTQTAGRGQHGRSWVSTPGNVFLSLYIPMKNSADGAAVTLSRLSGLLSLMVGLALAKMDALQTLNAALIQQAKAPVGVKWANDLGYYADYHDGDKRTLFQKLVGILIEPVYAKVNDKSVCVGVVIGVGLNVTHSPAIKDGLYHAAHLHGLWASVGQVCQLSAQDLYAPMCQAICRAITWHNKITDGTAAAEGEMARQAFINEFNAAHTLQGKTVEIFARDDMQVVDKAGVVVGIGADGALLLQTVAGQVAVYAGMVQSA